MKISGRNPQWNGECNSHVIHKPLLAYIYHSVQEVMGAHSGSFWRLNCEVLAEGGRLKTEKNCYKTWLGLWRIAFIRMKSARMETSANLRTN